MASLGQMAHTEGASRIAHEANERRIAIKCSVRGRDEGSFVGEAQAAVARQVVLPPGYHATWGGQFENQRRATQRLLLIVPASILLIFILLFSAFGSVLSWCRSTIPSYTITYPPVMPQIPVTFQKSGMPYVG